MAGLTIPQPLGRGLDTLLRPYSQVIFSRSRVSGALILLAVATSPHVAVATLLAVAVAQTVVIVAGLGVDAARDGVHASTAVLTTLALAYGLGAPAPALVAVSAVLAVCVSAAVRMALSGGPAAPLSLPFVISAWTALLASRVLPGATALAPAVWPIESWIASLGASLSWLDVPAAILFLPSAMAGLLLLSAIIWHSRIAALLALVGAAAAALTRIVFRHEVGWSDVDLTASFNATLTSMALGGVWFVPHPSSILLAAAGAMLTCVVTYALLPVASTWSLPLLSLPFAVTTIAVMYAMRLRQQDRSPASAPLANRPEDALSHHLMRVRRFGEFAWLPFRLPFRGPWLVTQGHNGAHTHKGPWRYALDFEIARPDADLESIRGGELADYACYGLPVLAAGSGTVDSVVDGVADNPINGLNARDNWGNVVVIAHAPNLFSVYAHLKPRSIRVKAGDLVKAGVEIGRCGNSGRSLVPHLHFQVQRTAVLGSETVPVDFGDVIARTNDRATLSHRVIPAEGAVVRPLVLDESLAQLLAFPPGSIWELRSDDNQTVEIATVDVDLWSRRVLQSSRGRLYVEPYDSGLIVVAFEGDRDSLLSMIRLAMTRVPFDQEGDLTWTDRVPRHLVWPGAEMFIDVAAVVAPGLTDLELTLTSHRTENAVTIDGDGGAVKTRLVISTGGQPHVIDVQRGETRRRVTLRRVPGDREENPK